MFLMGDLNVNYKNKSSPDYKKFNFFVQSNSLSQHISNTTRNTDKSKSLLDLALTNSKFICQAGTLNHYISDHQPIYLIHKKSRDKRDSVKFEGRSYRSFDENIFGSRMKELSDDKFNEIKDPEEAWEKILSNICAVLDEMCPVRSFHIKNYRPDWMTKELIEKIKDRDYFYKKAKLTGDEDAWNVAKHLRNTTNYNIRQAKREFILNELKTYENDAKKFWKVIRTVVPSDKSKGDELSGNIMLTDGENKVNKSDVAHFINNYFINVGKTTVHAKPSSSQAASAQRSNVEVQSDNMDLFSLGELSEKEVFDIIKRINISKSSGLDNVSSYVIKVAF